MIELTLPLPPSANRYWRNFRGRTVVSAEAKAYKDFVGVFCRMNEIEPIDGNVVIELDIYRERKRGDLDNRIKVCLDSLQGRVFEDDSQIVEIHARRFDDKDNPRVELKIWEAQS